MNKDLAKRKHIRLKGYDYSSEGAYFITICTYKRKCILSKIVGRGLAPAEIEDVEYTSFGEVADNYLKDLAAKYPFLTIDSYIIMPNHIHAIFTFCQNEEHISLSDIICAYKSLVVRECRKRGFRGRMFQESFFDHIIRDYNDYQSVVEYIYKNPMNWYYDKLYNEEN